MKKAITLLIFMLFTISAYADVEEFSNFSLDVPDGWSVAEEGAVVTVTKDDKSGSLSITADDPQGKTIEELAAMYSSELNGTAPEHDEDGGYTFEFNNGISQAVIDGNEDMYLFIVGTGIEQNGEVLSEILESLEMK